VRKKEKEIGKMQKPSNKGWDKNLVKFLSKKLIITDGLFPTL